MTSKIYFDLTTSYHFNGNPTGIARVEQRTYRALLNVYGDRVVPVAWNSRTRRFLILSQMHPTTHPKLDNLIKLEAAGSVTPFDPTKVNPGDRMIIVGGAWIRNVRYVMSVLNIKKSALLTLTILVHDIIHLKMGHLYPSDATEDFTNNIGRMATIADGFLCYSDTSTQDLHQVLVDMSLGHKPVAKFGLGDMTDDIKIVAAETSKVRDIRLDFEGQKFVLFVSSIDVRKNHILLINVWRRLIEKRGRNAPHLIFAGRSQWGGDEIVALVAREKMLTRNVHFLQDVDDASLDWLYRNCQFTVYPSLYEGWGLPIAESLAYGKVCIAADATSTAEVEPTLTIRIDPYDFTGWLSTVENLIDNTKELAKREQIITSSYKPHTWNSAVQQIVAAVESLPPATALPIDLPVIPEPVAAPPLDLAPPSPHAASLAAALSYLQVPDRLPPNRRAFRFLRLTGLDGLAIRLYRRVFNRTNESLRRVIEVLQATHK